MGGGRGKEGGKTRQDEAARQWCHVVSPHDAACMAGGTVYAYCSVAGGDAHGCQQAVKRCVCVCARARAYVSGDNEQLSNTASEVPERT